MIEQLRIDEKASPSAFVWYGAISPEALAQWTRVHDWSVPTDLRSVWLAKGGGDLFESESILCPLTTPQDNDIDFWNAELRPAGLPGGHLVFHAGAIGFTALRKRDQKYIFLGIRDLVAEAEFSSLVEWYRTILRAEFAARYGLDPTV